MHVGATCIVLRAFVMRAARVRDGFDKSDQRRIVLARGEV